MRIIQKNTDYFFQGIISSNIPLLSSVCLRSPVAISMKDWTFKCGVSIREWGMCILETIPKAFLCLLRIDHCYLRGIRGSDWVLKKQWDRKLWTNLLGKLWTKAWLTDMWTTVCEGRVSSRTGAKEVLCRLWGSDVWCWRVRIESTGALLGVILNFKCFLVKSLN